MWCQHEVTSELNKSIDTALSGEIKAKLALAFEGRGLQALCSVECVMMGQKYSNREMGQVRLLGLVAQDRNLGTRKAEIVFWVWGQSTEKDRLQMKVLGLQVIISIHVTWGMLPLEVMKRFISILFCLFFFSKLESFVARVGLELAMGSGSKSWVKHPMGFSSWARNGSVISMVNAGQSLTCCRELGLCHPAWWYKRTLLATGILTPLILDLAFRKRGACMVYSPSESILFLRTVVQWSVPTRENPPNHDPQKIS